MINANDIGEAKLPGAGELNLDNIYKNRNEIVGKYTAVGVTVPAGSMFYRDTLVTEDQLPGSWLAMLKTDANGITDTPFYVPVNLVTTYGNSIQPSDYIDIYMKARDESQLIMYGKLVENIEILAVKDGSGKDVFSGAESTLVPAYLYFGVMEELHILLKKAQYLTNLGVELIVVPHGGIAPIEGDIEVSSEYLRDYIEANTVKIPDNSELLELDEDGNAIDDPLVDGN
jgi:hypothetical protein